MKWTAPALAYLAVGLGMFVFHSAWGALLGFHIAIMGSLLIAKPKIPLSILFQSKQMHWVAMSVLLCGSSGLTIALLWNAFGFAPDMPQQVQALGLNTQTWIPFILYFTLVNPFIEEYFWRGFLGSDSTSPHLTDLIFAGYHLMILIHKLQAGWILYCLGVLIAAGWFWRQLFRMDGGLLAPVLGHMAADLSILLAIYFRTTL